MRTAITNNRAALRSAIESAAGRWEQAPSGGTGEDAWSPRQVAEHAIGADRTFAGLVAGAMQGKAPERKPFSFAAAADAATALDESGAESDKILRYVEDRDIEKTAALPDSLPFPRTIAGVMQLAAYHFADHARQIGG
jgi:hypothetical protein